jgi:hypothetical protein
MADELKAWFVIRKNKLTLLALEECVKNTQGDSIARGPKLVYMQIFTEFVNQLTDVELTTGYYQQDGATCRTSNASM